MAWKKVVALDFDGVIHKYTSKWVAEDIIPDGPVDGIKEFIDDLKKKYRVVIYSTRAKTEKGRKAIEKWLEENGISIDAIYYEKPMAFVYIDDRAIRFDGNVTGLREQIDNFKPWNK